MAKHKSGRMNSGGQKKRRETSRQKEHRPGSRREREKRGGTAGSSRGWGLAPGIQRACRDLLADQQ